MQKIPAYVVRTGSVVLLVLAMAGLTSVAQAAPGDCDPYPCCADKKPGDAPCPVKKYENLRFLENWRPCLCKDACDLEDWTDRIKARRLTRNGFLWANLGGQMRLRWESFSNIGFGAPADDNDAWMLLRARAHADIHFGENARLFIEGIYANQYETRELGARPIDKNKGDLLNAFFEVNATLGCENEVGVWAGRRELQTGKQRLVSPLDWANTRRTFQGAGGWWKQGGHQVDLWYTHSVVIENGALDDDWNEDSDFVGLNYKNATQDCRTWEGYFLGLMNDAVGNTPEKNRYTVGARVDGKIPNSRFDYDVEGAYQFGDQGAGDISAFMFSGTIGFKPCAPCWDPRIGLGFDYASGDDDPTNPDVGTFNQLFPLGHKYLGHADLIGRQNVMAARIEASVTPKMLDKLTLNAWVHLFWRADEADAVYNAGGGVLRAVPAVGNTDTAIGAELDIKATYKIDRHWVAFVEWAIFFTGDFIQNTGPSQDLDVWYIGFQGTF